MPLWATVNFHPGIWIRWTEAHEEWVESEQAIATGNRVIGIEVVGRIVKCGQYGEWMIGDWRPACATCRGTRMVEIGPNSRERSADGELRPDQQAWVDALVDTLDAGLYYLLVNLVECPACRAHPGWVAA